MKTSTFTTILLISLLHLACTKNDNAGEEASQGAPIDSSVVGKDSSPVSTRKDIENSDEQKLTLPGRDTTRSDEPQK
ncbi:hypothetical protein [Dyadobacter sp. 676]|uniref:Cytochrome C551 n=1 Tax=Dyadobacter sp. 676 TaxID=3088362 RepID=A0AAU8FNP4_9BACT